MSPGANKRFNLRGCLYEGHVWKHLGPRTSRTPLLGRHVGPEGLCTAVMDIGLDTAAGHILLSVGLEQEVQQPKVVED